MCRGCVALDANGNPPPEPEYTAEEWAALEARHRVTFAQMQEYRRRLDEIVAASGRKSPA